MLVDTHVHSLFSTDAHQTMQQAADAAIAAGLSGIAFTDHFDYDYNYDSDEPIDSSGAIPKNQFRFDVDEYFKEITKVKEMYKGRINIYCAIEVGIQPHCIKEINEIIDNIESRYEYDFILGSTHMIHRIDPYLGKYYRNMLYTDKIRDKYEAYLEYILEVYKNILLFNNYDAMAHFDYLTRYAPYEDKSFKYNDYKDVIDLILKHLIDNGKAFEINTATYKKSPLDTKCLKRYKEFGGEMVTIGSDAHRDTDLARIFNEYLPVIKDCGFDYVVHYEKRKPVFDKI